MARFVVSVEVQKVHDAPQVRVGFQHLQRGKTNYEAKLKRSKLVGKPPVRHRDVDFRSMRNL